MNEQEKLVRYQQQQSEMRKTPASAEKEENEIKSRVNSKLRQTPEREIVSSLEIEFAEFLFVQKAIQYLFLKLIFRRNLCRFNNHERGNGTNKK